MTDFIVNVLKTSLLEMIYLTGIIIVVGYILGVFENLVNAYMSRLLGRKGVIITAWLGTPIHEFGHAIMCIIFRHRIVDMKLLTLNDSRGRLGYVLHSFNKCSWYERVGNLFIGVGPIISGTLSLIVSLYLLLPVVYIEFSKFIVNLLTEENVSKGLLSVFRDTIVVLLRSICVKENITNPLFWLFIFVAICISSHIALSSADIEGAKDGFITLFILLVLVNGVLSVFSMNNNYFFTILMKYNIYLTAFLAIAVVCSGITVIISMILVVLLRK